MIASEPKLDGNLTLEELQAAADELCQKHWNVNYTGNIEIVKRGWSALNGKFIWKQYSDPNAIPMIRMCQHRNAERTRTEVLGTLLHELVHWRLATQGIPHRDANDEFIAECLRLGAPISKSTSAQRAFVEFQAKRAYEQRTGRKYDEDGGSTE